MVRKLLVLALAFAFVALSTSAWGQYTGGMPGTTGTTGSPTYQSKSYGVNKAAIGAIVGGGAVAGVLLFRHFHHARTMTACVGPDGKTLDDGKNVYTVIGGGVLTPNERVIVAGKKSRVDGGRSLELTGVREHLGQCVQPTLSAHH